MKRSGSRGGKSSRCLDESEESAGESSPQTFSRWRVEHARDPEEATTPRSAAADAVGKELFEEKLGIAAVETVKDDSTNLAAKLAHHSKNYRRFGAVLRELADFEEVPSRIEIKQALIEKGEIEPGEIAAEQVGKERRKAIIRQIGQDDVISAAEMLFE